MEHDRKRAGWGREAPGTPKNTAEAWLKRPPGLANHAKAYDHGELNQAYLAGPLKNGGEGSVPAKVDLAE